MSFRCAHIADVHFRGLSRHEQYRTVFEQFFEQMQKEKPDVIFVGGDIVHSKTQGISPELIEILTWWFRRLSESAKEVHVILGNHDGLILNNERQDTITPIVSALKLENVFLHKESGTYKTCVPGYNFCVFSCFDEDGWKNVKPIPGEVNIACYHGSVVGSLTDIDWELEGEVDTTFFDAFDFAFLGDIHRWQFLGDDDRIAYCGSTIQQNFGEDLTKGYLLWHIEDRERYDVNFKPLDNPTPFVTIEWKGTSQETLDSIDIPKGARIRVQSKRPIEQTSWTHLKSHLKEHYSAKELVYDLRREERKAAEIGIESGSEDYRDFTTLSKYFNEWFNTLEFSEEETEAAFEYLKKVFDSLPPPDGLRNVRWTVDALEFDNAFSYGTGNRIDFDSLRGLIGIFGQNRAGKSSIPGTLMYALFNGSDRGSLKNIHIVNVRKNYCKASVDISVAGSRYRIERQTTKRENRKGEVHAATHMNMFEIDSAGNIIKDMTDEQRRETEKHVRNLIGTGENFLMTTFASQGAMNNFIKERATNRKSVLTSFLDFDVFEEIHKAARSDMGELKGRLSDVQRRDFSSIEQEKTLELTRAQKNLDALTENLKKNTSDLEVVQDKLSQLPSDTVTQADVDEQEAKIKHAIAGIGDLKDQKEKFINEWRDKKEKVDSLKEFVESSGFEKMNEDSKKATRIKRELEKLQREMQFLEKKVASLSDPEFLKGCKCLREAEESLKKKPALAGKIESLSSTYDLLDVENLNERIRKVTAIRETVHTIERELKSTVSRSGIYDEKIKVLQDRLQLDEEKLSKMKMHMTDAPIDEMVSNLKREKRELERLIREDDGKRISAAKTIGTIQAQIKKLREEKKKFEELNREWKIVEIVAEASSKKGIPLRILNGKLPQVNSEIAQILQGSTGFTIELEADPDSNAMDIYINYGDSRRIIECASGMEKMMASLAIRVALMNLTALPRCDLLIIDEGFGALDETNVEACSALLHGLTKYFKTILIISHVDAVKDSVDNVLSISKRGQDSYVNTSG